MFSILHHRTRGWNVTLVNKFDVRFGPRGITGSIVSVQARSGPIWPIGPSTRRRLLQILEETGGSRRKWFERLCSAFKIAFLCPVDLLLCYLWPTILSHRTSYTVQMRNFQLSYSIFRISSGFLIASRDVEESIQYKGTTLRLNWTQSRHVSKFLFTSRYPMLRNQSSLSIRIQCGIDVLLINLFLIWNAHANS